MICGSDLKRTESNEMNMDMTNSYVKVNMMDGHHMTPPAFDIVSPRRHCTMLDHPFKAVCCFVESFYGPYTVMKYFSVPTITSISFPFSRWIAIHQIEPMCLCHNFFVSTMWNPVDGNET